MGLFVKICGISNRADAEAVARLHPDAMGFVFWPRSPRCVAPRDVAAWGAALPPGILKVGLFVDADPVVVARVVKEAGLDVAQLHGRESPAACKAVGGKVWKAVHLDEPGAPAPKGYRVDAFLIDHYSPDSPGGTGMPANWETAHKFVTQCKTPVLLAGGLRPDNVEAAVRAVRPWGVDVSSGVEARPGHKDLGRVRDFIDRCRYM